MFDYNVIEGNEASSEMEYFSEIQKAINSGYAWKFQGSYGRSMMDAIESGNCMLGNNDAYDYYGNRIPSRFQVKDGTKGSFDYVAERNGRDYADCLASL